jgi:hypothetical protein
LQEAGWLVEGGHSVSEALGSIMVGTGGLTVLALVALALTLTRSLQDTEASAHRALVRTAALAILLQAAHFVEELATGFHVRFPELLDLSPWPRAFFVAFNVAWICVWGVSVAGVRMGVRGALFPVWFLALAMTLNGVVTPLLSYAVSGYFPGLWTSPLLAVLGVLLLRRLFDATGPASAASDRA